MEKTRRRKHFVEVFYWKQSLKQTMMMCSFFLCKFEDLYGIVFLFDFGKSVLNRTQGLFWFGVVHSDSTFQWSVSIFFLYRAVVFGGLFLRGENFYMFSLAYVTVCCLEFAMKKWVTEQMGLMCHWDLSWRTDEAIFFQRKTFFFLYPSWASVSV